jgi:hypothetical protein
MSHNPVVLLACYWNSLFHFFFTFSTKSRDSKRTECCAYCCCQAATGLEKVGSSMSHNPVVLHACYWNNLFNFFFTFSTKSRDSNVLNVVRTVAVRLPVSLASALDQVRAVGTPD